MVTIDRQTAREVVEKLGSHGIPPDRGIEYFTVFLDQYLSVLESDYLSSYIKEDPGGAAFKMVVGIYGGGKTHFLYCVRDLAWKHRYAVSYVTLSPRESPFHRLDLVYRAIAQGIYPPVTEDELATGFERGLPNLIKHWYGQAFHSLVANGKTKEEARDAIIERSEQISGLESKSFQNAIRAAIRAVAHAKQDEFDSLCQWLSAEGYDAKRHKPFNILQRIDKSTAFTMLRSLCQWVREIGYSGLVVLLDEAERQSSMSTKEREQLLSNLRELIDECGHGTLHGVMLFYAVPDENFLEGRALVYEALKQRVETVFGEPNPSGVKIILEDATPDRDAFMSAVGVKLKQLYEIAYGVGIPDGPWVRELQAAIANANEKHFADEGWKRVFMKDTIGRLHGMRASFH